MTVVDTLRTAREFIVWMPGARPQRVSCYDTGTPGIVVHEAINHYGWSVSHEKTGKRIGDYCNTRREAFQFAIQLRDLADWTLSSKQLKAVSGLGLRVKALRS